MKKRRVEFYEENETTAGRRTYDVHDCSNKCWNFSICIHTRSGGETNESTKTESSKETAQKVMDQYQKIEGIDSEKTILGADFSHYQQNVGWNKVWKDYKGNAVNNLFSYVKTQGINTISVKIAVNPGKDINTCLWRMPRKH